ncbi:porin [Cupriavidus basilensis]|uniref:Outer membrane protein (Porin) n=1 Tax=Cupriavidus basilensis TaxID=68895 RepID=A0A0C4YND1_9BURK|nr:porin [Cupriavidus basilensis]AJG22061.1 Outer membrane protein (porin) [Cupriavidus basilensis]
MNQYRLAMHVAKHTSLGAISTLMACAAHAQSSAAMYGTVESGIRYATNASKTGDGKLELTAGALNGSRFGLRGTEDLGAGVAAVYVLEAGFDLGTGSAPQSSVAGYGQASSGGAGRMFSRQAFVGMQSRFGAITLGQLYGAAYQATAGAQIFGNLSLDTLAITRFYTGSRQDNAVKYEGKAGSWKLAAHHAFGEVPGNTRANASTGTGLSYDDRRFRASAFYQQARSADGAQARKTVGATAGYASGRLKATAGYLSNRYSATGTRNDVVIGGVSYQVSPAWLVGVGAFHDEQKDPGGRRSAAYLIADYRLSKRTDVFFGADYNRITGGYALIKSQGRVGAKVGAMVGLRHVF